MIARGVSYARRVSVPDRPAPWPVFAVEGRRRGLGRPRAGSRSTRCAGSALPVVVVVGGGLVRGATGACSFYAIADWLGGVSPEVLERLGIRFRVPIESAIRLAIGRVDGGVLDRCWVRIWRPRQPRPVSACRWRWTARRCAARATATRWRRIWLPPSPTMVPPCSDSAESIQVE